MLYNSAMMKSYEDFKRELSEKIKDDEELYYDILLSAVKNPQRYTGIFRTTNAKTKLIQNLTQSREIKFGDFMEELITWYIAEMGYKNFDKIISDDETDKKKRLEADQLFGKEGTVYVKR